MRLIGWWFVALLSLTSAQAGRRPRYGGTLTMDIRETVKTLDPSANCPLLPLAFDRLTTLDGAGEPRPALAVSWTRDAEARRWEFRLRQGVRFHNGSVLSAGPAVAAALESTLKGIAVKARGDALIFESPRPAPWLAAELAVSGYVFARTAEGDAIGTGPFKLTRWNPGRHATFTANEDHWRGRPFVDAIEIEMGRRTRDQMLDLEVGRADVVELTPLDARRWRRVWASAPIELLAVSFRDGGAPMRLREALAAAVDRAAIHNVIFQRQGEVAGGLLPQWISGYAFLFSAAADLPRARKLAAESAARGLSLDYDAGDRVARLVAERIALNARDAGITVAVGPNPRADATIRRLRICSPEPARALEDLGFPESRRAATPQGLYASERALLETWRMIPLLHVPVTYGAGTRVRTWSAAPLTRTGELRVADLWLEARP